MHPISNKSYRLIFWIWVIGIYLLVGICGLEFNAINLRQGVIHVGAAFQPRLNGYYFRVTSFRGWKATPTWNKH